MLAENDENDYFDQDKNKDQHKMDSEHVSLSNHLNVKGFTHINYFKTAVMPPVAIFQTVTNSIKLFHPPYLPFILH